MVVVTDTSPINYLILTGYVDVLPALHGEVVIPQAVARALRAPRTSLSVTGDDILRPGANHSRHTRPLCAPEPSEALEARMT